MRLIISDESENSTPYFGENQQGDCNVYRITQ